MTKFTIKETFTYSVDAESLKDIWTVKNDVDCVEDMPTPFGDGYPSRLDVKYEVEIL